MKVGITGGIGAGKSYISRVFKALGVPFYDADREAKLLMDTDLKIRTALVEMFGQEVYNNEGRLDRSYIAAQVFGDSKKLDKLNAIVHPIVIQHAEEWAMRQSFPYTLKEAALLFESGSYKNLDHTILVTAPLEKRIERVMLRDSMSREQVMERVSKQLPDRDKEVLADSIIVNDGVTPLLPQILHLHEKFLKNPKQ